MSLIPCCPECQRQVCDTALACPCGAVLAEPIFSRQEQGVVYLFSRYWHKIDKFRRKRIYNIHTHFPDFYLEDTGSRALEALEFEYCLSGFSTHIPEDLRKLRDYDGRAANALYIVYWEQDDDRERLRKRIGRHFKGAVEFVCLSEYFSPLIRQASDRLRAFWQFNESRTNQFAEVYTFEEIRERTKALVRDGVVECLPVQKAIYRVAGFNKGVADFIECDHWKRIHFYTTSPFHADNVPSRLFVKPTGCKRFSGCFEIKHAFTAINGRNCSLLEDYFREYYFYPYDPENYYSTCLVYTTFTELNPQQGSRLYAYLQSRYALRQAPEVIWRSKHIAEIDRIVKRA